MVDLKDAIEMTPIGFLFNQIKQKQNTKEQFSSDSGAMAIFMMINLVIWAIGFYFMIRCGATFFDVIGFCCATPCYVLYRLLNPC